MTVSEEPTVPRAVSSDGIVWVIARLRRLEVRFFAVYLALMLLGASLYALQYYLALRSPIPLWFVADPILLVLGLLLVRPFSSNREPG